MKKENPPDWIPLEIIVYDHLSDHRFLGRAVLPAVEAMRLLHRSASEHVGKRLDAALLDARFDKFLFLPPDRRPVPAFNELSMNREGVITSRLITRTRAPKSGITRVKEHASVRFVKKADFPDFQPLVQDIHPTGRPDFQVSARAIYQELVPFEPAFQNIVGEADLYRDHARACVRGCPEGLTMDASPLGSPFPLDAAFHAACVWGQRYAGFVAFPVGFAARRVFHPTRLKETYRAVASPVQVDSDVLVFDLDIYDENGQMMERVSGVRMRDVSGGRLKPPSWISEER